jgi:hypothetical protein
MSKTAKIFQKLNQLRKVRSKFNPTDVYYTDTSWTTKEVEGVEFIYVIRDLNHKTTPKLMRKDSLEYLR